MKKEIKTELIRVVQERYNETKAEEKAVKYSKCVARKNMWKNIKLAMVIIVLIMLFVLYGILESTIL